MQLAGSHNTSISRLSFATRNRDTLRVQLALQRLLAPVDLHPAGLPPTSIVCIRKFSAPGFGSSLREPPNLPWQQAVRDSLATQAATAVRPINGFAPAGVNAVFFSDVAEMLACLARDWTQGNVYSRWWWRVLLKNESSLARIWSSEPQFIPATIEHLARMHAIDHVAPVISAVEAGDLTLRVTSTFGLNKLFELAKLLVIDSSPFASSTPNDISSQSISKPRTTQSESSAIEPPWQRWLSDSVLERLLPAQQLFFGIALSISREPARVRTTGYAQDVKVWCEQVARRTRQAVPALSPIAHEHSRQIESGDLNSNEKIKAAPRYAETYEPQQRSNRQVMPAAVADGSTNKFVLESSHTEIGSASDPPPRLPAQEEIVRELPPAVELESSDVRTDLRVQQESDEPVLDGPQFAIQTSPKEEPTIIDDLSRRTAFSIETELGGLFYLINLALYLDLYGDFTRPLSPGIELSIWDFVVLLGRELAGKSDDDPIWMLLADLAGRDYSDEPGATFEPTDDWRVPRDWLKPFAAGASAEWHLRDDRLLLVHSAGFSILDAPLELENLVAQQSREIEPYKDLLCSISIASSITPNESLANPISNTRLRIWLSHLMPYVRARLRLALGLAPTEEIAPTLLRRFSRVQVTGTHLDITFMLSDSTVEVRLAGLDRDPGWVPAAGRFISFHYH